MRKKQIRPERLNTENNHSRWGRVLLATIMLCVLATPILGDSAEVAVAHKGADVWRTAGSGSTFTSFTDDPIPADFFCLGSKVFDGGIKLMGKPLATKPAGVLGQADTIVERLDDATFDATGLAITRIRLRALSLVSEEPVDLGCARLFDVAVTLAGEQPITEMRIQKTSANSGTYHAPLALRVRMAFSPVGGGDTLEVVRRVDLGPGDNTYWTTSDRVGMDIYGNPVLVDTNGDGVPDSATLGQSNFHTGMALAALKQGPNASVDQDTDTDQTNARAHLGEYWPPQCPERKQTCHCDPNSTNPSQSSLGCAHLHCIFIYQPCPYLQLSAQNQ